MVGFYVFAVLVVFWALGGVRGRRRSTRRRKP